jgi:Trk K+ transport system NAD-binding subunit
MRISVIGCGYLGALHATSMATLGHEVVGIDVDQRTVERWTAAGWTYRALAAAPAEREEIHGSRS